MGVWRLSHRQDVRSRLVADRHYNRQKIGTPGFVPPGRCMVLYAKENDCEALWVTSWPFAEYVRHRWGGAWVCSAFRNEGVGKASELIAEAVGITRHMMGEPPDLGMITFVNREKVKPTMVKGKPVWGWTYMKVGFEPDGETEGGLTAIRLPPLKVPPAIIPRVEPDMLRIYEGAMKRRGLL